MQEEIFKTKESMLKTKEKGFNPSLFYQRFKISKDWNLGKLSNKEWTYIYQLNENSEKFIFNAYMSFIRAKAEFLKGENTIEEIYAQEENCLGLDNYGYIDFFKNIFEFTRFFEYNIDKINFRKLRGDLAFYSCKQRIQGFPSSDEKQALINIRNSLAHNGFRITVEKGVPKIVITNIERCARGVIKMDSKTLIKFINILKSLVDPEIDEYFEKRDKAKAKLVYRKSLTYNKNLFKIKNYNISLTQQKQEMIDFVFFKKINSKNGVRQNANAMLNALIVENPKLSLEEVFSLFYKEIRKNFSVFKKGEFVDVKAGKREALFFAEDKEKIKGEDALELAQYIFTSKKFRDLNRLRNLPKDLIMFLDRRFDIEGTIKDKKLNTGEEKDPYKIFLNNLRHSVIHDKVIIDERGNLIFKIMNSEGHKVFKKIKEGVEKLKPALLNYKEKLYSLTRTYTPKHETLVTVGSFSCNDLLKFCQLIMDADTNSKKRIKTHSQNELGNFNAAYGNKPFAKKQMAYGRKGNCKRKKKNKDKNSAGKASKNIKDKNKRFLHEDQHCFYDDFENE